MNTMETIKSETILENLHSYPLDKEQIKLVQRVIYYLDNSANKGEFMRAMNDLISEDQWEMCSDLSSLSDVLSLGLSVYNEQVKECDE